MTMLRIDGVDMPVPSVYKLPRFDMDSEDTNRNEEGRLQRDRIRQGIFKIELEWWSITSSQLHTIETAIAPASLQVTFITAIGPQTKTMYAGDRNIGMALYDEKTDDIRWDVSFNLIEY
jgi:hypothetical protein